MTLHHCTHNMLPIPPLLHPPTHRVVSHSEVNKMQPQNIAIVFGPTLLRTENPLLIATLTPVQNGVVGSLLTDFDKIF